MTGLVQPFISTLAGTLDAKGRVCIPSSFRQVLAAQNSAGVYLCPSFFESALEGFGQALLDSVHARLAARDPFFTPGHDDEASAIVARTHLLALDENGRVVLPASLIEHVGLKDRVVFVGLSQKFQIWDADRYAPVEAERLARVKAKFLAGRGGDA